MLNNKFTFGSPSTGNLNATSTNLFGSSTATPNQQTGFGGSFAKQNTATASPGLTSSLSFSVQPKSLFGQSPSSAASNQTQVGFGTKPGN